MARAAVSSKRAKRRGAEASADASFATRVGSELVGVVLLGGALLASLALATYQSSDPTFALEPVANAAGVVGASLAGGLFALLGYGAVVLVAAMAWIGARLCLQQGPPALRSRFWPGAILLLLASTTLPPILQEIAPARFGSAVAGGVVGSWLATSESMLVSRWGALLLNSFLFTLGGLSILGISTGAALAAIGAGASATGSVALNVTRLLLQGLGRGFDLLRDVGHGALARVQRGVAALGVLREQRARRQRAARARRLEEVEDAPGPGSPVLSVEGSAIPEAAPVPAPTPRPRTGDAAGPDIVDHASERAASRKPEQETFHFEENRPSGPFKLPDLSIFQRPPEDSRTYDRDSLLMNSRILEKKLQDFGVKGTVVRVHPGPVITMYEYEPAPGVKVNKIVNLSDDLTMALRALSIRIIAPLPGKSVVGIEVPNTERDTVYMRTSLESESFRGKSSKLSLAMGKDIFGNEVTADLAKMPHLLVAGATGTGKSVFLNSLLCSLLSRATPDELKLLLVDPKLLELSVYERIPHLIADVVTNPKRAAAALQGVVRKMEDRYQMMSACQVRNVDQFNRLVDEKLDEGTTHFRLRPKPGEEQGDEVEYRRLPYIVVVIDELADLMVLAAKDVEESLQRLAQMARAAGIHLVLATQRPSVDVLTGVIKANFPARLSFQVSSRTDSRTILDQNGAENLLGQGDMLFLPPGTSRLQRLHGSYVSEKEVAELAAALRDQGAPQFDESLMKIPEEGEGPGQRDEDVDEMFDQAVAIVAETRNASISYVQRRLKIGYNRAARIVEYMENDGMVGPQVGTRPREVFLRKPGEDE